MLFVHRELKIRRDGVRKARRVVNARGGDHRVVIQALRKLDELLVEAGDLLYELLDLRSGFDFRGKQADGGAKEAFFGGNGNGTSALDAFNQHFDIAVGQLDALDDVREGADRVNLLGLRVIDRSIMLGRKKDLLVAGKRFFQRANAGFAADDKRGHLLRKNDHIAHRHHGYAFHFLFLTSEHAGP